MRGQPAATFQETEANSATAAIMARSAQAETICRVGSELNMAISYQVLSWHFDLMRRTVIPCCLQAPWSCVEPSSQTACYWRLVVLGGGPSGIASAAWKRLQNSMNSGAATSEIAQ
jgi:hypothetical protein